jgi:hypothetical protein
MAKWQYTLNLSDFYHDDKLSIEEKAKKVSERLSELCKRMHKSANEDVLFLVSEIEDIAENFLSVTETDEFNGWIWVNAL